MRTRLAALIAGAAFAAGCHSEPTEPGGSKDAEAAAQTLLHVADSLAAHGGTTTEVGAYRGLASLLMGTGRLSTVTISVDGAVSEYLATAQEIVLGACGSSGPCPMLPTVPIRTVVAWEKANPRRVVQLFGPTYLGVTDLMPGAGSATLMLLDGAGAMYGGTAASQSLSVTVSETQCAPPDARMPAIWAPSNCRQAEFDVGFDGTLALVPFKGMLPDTIAAPPAPDAPPSHRVTMAQQQVHGGHVELEGICIDFCQNDPNPPGVTPTVPVPSRDSLTATLTATVGSDVTFTFTVKNTKSTSTEVRFSDAQQFDIRVWNGADTQVWRWSAGKVFAQSVTSRTLGPGESATYVEHWTPPAAGSYRAMAYLTSTTHAAVGFANVSAP